MSITNTPFMGLIKPDGSEHIKNWPWQNFINSMLLDNKVKITSHTYTPELEAGNTNPTLGTGGEIEGKYFRISNSWILAYGRYTFGTSMDPGDGQYTMSLPVAGDPNFHESVKFDVVGSFVFLDNSDSVANAKIGMVDIIVPDLNTVRFFYGIGTGDTINHDQPVTQASEDSLSFYCMYKEAPVV